MPSEPCSIAIDLPGRLGNGGGRGWCRSMVGRLDDAQRARFRERLFETSLVVLLMLRCVPHTAESSIWGGVVHTPTRVTVMPVMPPMAPTFPFHTHSFPIGTIFQSWSHRVFAAIASLTPFFRYDAHIKFFSNHLRAPRGYRTPRSTICTIYLLCEKPVIMNH